MNKKQYKAPKLTTTKIALGVFGSYGSTPTGKRDNNPNPVYTISDLNLHME